ncbi:MAG: ATP-dependent DNA helicase [Candidatus Woesearchaeota archaeon]
MEKIKREEVIFPYDQIREKQDDLMNNIIKGLNSNRRMIFHAPTGLGKTVAALAPMIKYAKMNKKKIMFLTTTHTQHKIVLETVKKMNEISDERIIVSDLLGKRWLCSQEDLDIGYNNEFIEYCKQLRKEKKCRFYNKTFDRGSVSEKTEQLVNRLRKKDITAKKILNMSKEETLCGYEVAIHHSKDADIIIGDYHYMFNPEIRKSFLKRIDSNLKDILVIVDEAHNLTSRLRESASDMLTTNTLINAISEAEKYGFNDLVKRLSKIKLAITIKILKDILKKHSFRKYDYLEKKLEEDYESKIDKNFLLKLIEGFDNYEALIDELDSGAEFVREKRYRSYLGSISRFLKGWPHDSKGYLKYYSLLDNLKKGEQNNYEHLKKLIERNTISIQANDKNAKIDLIADYLLNRNIVIKNSCLDPSIVSKKVIDDCDNMLLMSGTLTPIKRYSDLLGFSKPLKKEFESPFPKENRKLLLNKSLTSKYTERGYNQYELMAKYCYRLHQMNKNVIIFFPSYYMLKKIYSLFSEMNNENLLQSHQKRVFTEFRDMTLEDKNSIINFFKKSKNKRKITLFAVAGGNFSEGIDMPNVIDIITIIGLPLAKPTLLTKATIDYYDYKFGKGWEYAYTIPAINRVLQAAGRAIRSENDKGVIIFADKRYSKYKKYFPHGYNLEVHDDNDQIIQSIELFYDN